MTENATRRELQTSDIQDLAPRLPQLMRNVAGELRCGAPLAEGLGLDHSLESDYGLDSLSRVDLVSRIERELGLSLGEAALSEAETPRELLRAITAGPAADAAIVFAPEAAREPSAVGYPPDSAATWVEVLDWHAQRHGDKVSITLHSDGGAATDLTYARLRRDARAVATGLVEEGCGAGDAVAIMLPTGADFFAALYGALYAGCVPVPVYPPARPSQLAPGLLPFKLGAFVAAASGDRDCDRSADRPGGARMGGRARASRRGAKRNPRARDGARRRDPSGSSRRARWLIGEARGAA